CRAAPPRLPALVPEPPHDLALGLRLDGELEVGELRREVLDQREGEGALGMERREQAGRTARQPRRAELDGRVPDGAFWASRGSMQHGIGSPVGRQGGLFCSDGRWEVTGEFRTAPL